MSLTDDPRRQAAGPDRELSAPLGRRSRRRNRTASRLNRQVALRLLVLFLVGIAATAVVGDVSLVHGRQVQDSVTAHLKAGADDLLAGKQSVGDATSKNDATRLVVANQQFARSRAHFESALHQVQGDPVLVGASLVPSLGPRLRSAAAVAEMGIALDDAGAGAASIDGTLLK